MTLWGTVGVHSRRGGGLLKPKWGSRGSNINDVGSILRRYFNDKPSEEHGGCNMFEWILDHKGTIYPEPDMTYWSHVF